MITIEKRKEIMNTIRDIEIRTGTLGLSGGSYLLFKPTTTIGEIQDKIRSMEGIDWLHRWDTAIFWKDWRLTALNENNLLYNSDKSLDQQQYKFTELLLTNHPDFLYIGTILDSLYATYGLPLQNHVSSVIIEEKKQIFEFVCIEYCCGKSHLKIEAFSKPEKHPVCEHCGKPMYNLKKV